MGRREVDVVAVVEDRPAGRTRSTQPGSVVTGFQSRDSTTMVPADGLMCVSTRMFRGVWRTLVTDSTEMPSAAIARRRLSLADELAAWACAEPAKPSRSAKYRKGVIVIASLVVILRRQPLLSS